MEKTNVCRTEIMRSRVLDYQPVTESESITTFEKRIQEQIRCIRVGDKNGTLNDTKKAENYAKKCERFLALPYFSDKKYKGKSVGVIKDDLKVQVGSRKDFISILTFWYDKKRDMKLAFVESVSPLSGSFSQKKRHEIAMTRKRMYMADISFLQEKLQSYEATKTALTSFLGVLINESFMDYVGAKRTWKVSMLKEKIISLCHENLEIRVEDKIAGVSLELLNSLLLLKYFKYKRYLDLEVRELMKTVSIDIAILEKVLDNLTLMLAIAKEKLKFSKMMSDCEDISMEITRALELFDSDLKMLYAEKKKMEKDYSLYRFGQGLIENDIFESLYV